MKLNLFFFLNIVYQVLHYRHSIANHQKILMKKKGSKL